jgi:hypothetical protein
MPKDDEDNPASRRKAIVQVGKACDSGDKKACAKLVDAFEAQVKPYIVTSQVAVPIQFFRTYGTGQYPAPPQKFQLFATHVASGHCGHMTLAKTRIGHPRLAHSPWRFRGLITLAGELLESPARRGLSWWPLTNP